jgi:hypothetical protein
MTAQSYPIQASRRGAALVLGTLLILVLASAATILTTVTLARFEEQGRRADEVILMATAESAFNEAFDYFQADADRLPTAIDAPVTYDGDDIDSPIFSAAIPHNHLRVSVTVTLLEDLDTSVWGDESYRFTATATAGGEKGTDAHWAEKYRRRVVEAIIRPSEEEVLKQCMFAILGYEFMGSAQTDSYDSSTSPYSVPPDQSYLNSAGDISSGGSIVVSNTGVHGNVIPNQELYLPVMNFDPPAGSIAVPIAGGVIDGNYTFSAPGTYTTNGLDMSGNILRIEGGGTVKLYVNGPCVVEAELQFDSLDSVFILYQNDYIGSATTLNGNADLGTIVPVAGGAASQLARPEQFRWISNYTGEITLNGTASISAVVVAPYATFNMNGTFDFFGALIAGSFDDQVNGNFSFHYDESLAGLGLGLEPRLQVAGWRSYNLSYDQ